MGIKLALIALCVLCMGASDRKPGVYTVTIQVDTVYEHCGKTKDGADLYVRKIDTTETWADQSVIADSVWGRIQDWRRLDSVTTIPLPCLTFDTLGIQAW